MLTISNTVIPSPDQMEFLIQGMRNPKNSWDRSDSVYDSDIPGISVGGNDKQLMYRLAAAGTEHRKFMRMMSVGARITAPLYWWKEFDTYKIGTASNSCSTMHKIADHHFTIDDFSVEHLGIYTKDDEKLVGEDLWPRVMVEVIKALNKARDEYLKCIDPTLKKQYWWQMIQLLPSSYNQTRNIMMNYEVLANIVKQRSGHKLDEWHTFCDWATNDIPYTWLITGDIARTIED